MTPHPFTVLLVMVLQLALIFAVIAGITLLVAWLHHLWAHRERRLRTIEENLRRLAWANALQILACVLLGGAIAAIYFAGYLFEATGGWR